jgi:tripartite-type tricarboxylate transporter receptor subunit TctC
MPIRLNARTVRLLAGAIVLFVASAGPASAEADYPSRPIKLVVPFPAGGGIDGTARIAAASLSNVVGQQVVVQNVGGAGGAIGTDSIAKAEPDGYSLLYHSTTGIVHAAVTEKLPYDWLRDLAPVAIITRFAPVMIIAPTVPAADLKEFIALLKANPGKYSFASSGTGTAVHLAEELFKQKAGVNMVHVPYRGSAPMLTDLLGGQVQVTFDNMPSSIEHIRAGKLRPLAVTTTARSEALPDTPVLADTVPGYEASAWFGAGAPKGTPSEIIEKLNKEINAGLADPKMQARLADLGGMLMAGSPADFGKIIVEETEKWAKVVKFSGAKAE